MADSDSGSNSETMVGSLVRFESPEPSVGLILKVLDDAFSYPSEDEPVMASEDNEHAIVALPGGGSRILQLSTLETIVNPKANAYNPVEHPRDPETGEFVSRPYDPDDIPDDPSQIADADGPLSQIGTDFIIDDYDVAGEYWRSIGWKGWPPTWVESEKPAERIFIDMFSSMEASYSGCLETMRGEIAYPETFCAGTCVQAFGSFEEWVRFGNDVPHWVTEDLPETLSHLSDNPR